METKLSELLRDLIINSGSIAIVAGGSGVSSPTLQKFVRGKPNGQLADVRLSSESLKQP